MECNKEEAFRAKVLAEKKMESKDFLGARKIAIKAQNLYPGLENISQLIMVCDVHCSAENKILGTEMDWYGILKLEPKDDDILIKKQFRKFALYLHPDKNKFPGAADAFNLIGEAQRVLLDPVKRKVHDMKHKSTVVNGAPKQASRPSNVRRPHQEKSSMNTNKQFQQAPQTAQPGSNNNKPTFWTKCPFCSIKYQYYRNVLNRNLCCQHCEKAFTAYEFNGQGTAPQNSLSQSAFLKQTGAHNQAPCEVGPRSNAEFSTMKVEVGGNTRSSEVAQGSKPNEKIVDVSVNFNQKRKAEIPQPCGKLNEKKTKQFFEFSKSCNSEGSTKFEEEVPIEGGGLYCEPFLQRSSRSKSNVSFTSNINDYNDIVEPTEANKFRDSPRSSRKTVEDISLKQEPPGMNGLTGLDDHMEENEEEDIMKKKPSEDAKAEQETFDYPDPDFSDFEKNRVEEHFAAGQIWAVYDTLDAMPRFYAQIVRVLHPKFKLRITWLEPDSNDMDEIKWAQEDLPVSCGKFRLGNSENTEDHLMFSHMVSCWEKGSRRNTYKIYPRKGETWALFKNWDINWSSDPENHRIYEYEFVEVLSDYADGTAITVAYLGKVKGYVCVFCRKEQGGVDIFQVEPKEMLRFSHRIPSFQLIEEELIDTLKGSFELDPVCLPPNIQEINPPTIEEMRSRKMHSVDPCSTFATNTKEPIPNIHVDVSKNQAEQEKRADSYVDLSTDEEDQKIQSDASSNIFVNPTEDAVVAPDFSEGAYEIPDPEFYDFDANKSIEKFDLGQVWALYCDEDGMPKYYGWIQKIEMLPVYKLHVVWLVVSSKPNGMIQWIDKKIPISCGRFKLKKGKPSEYTSTAPFSHQVGIRLEVKGKKEEYVILPRKGEIWALYKGWNAGLKCSDLENCEYDIVEVVEENQSGISVLSLEGVDGFKSVFRVQVKGQFPVTFTVPANELLRFSHQIPAYRLTEGQGGSLRGYLELDPAAFPFQWFCKD